MKFKNTSLLFLISFLIFSCQKEKDIIDDSNNRIAIITNLSDIVDVVDSDIRLFNLFIDQASKEFDYNVTMKRSNALSEWSAFTKSGETVMMEWEKNSSDVPVTAVYCDNSSIGDFYKQISSTLPSVQNEENIKANDILYFNKSVTPSEKGDKLYINFRHLLSKLRAVPNIDALDTDEYTIESLTIKNVKRSYSWTPVNGNNSLEAGDRVDDLTFYNNQDGSYECLCVPQELQNDSYLEIVILDKSGKSYIQKEPFTDGTELSDGNEYLIEKLMVNNPQVTPSEPSKINGLSLKIVDWESIELINGRLEAANAIDVNDPKYLSLDMESMINKKELIEKGDPSAITYYNNLISNANKEISSNTHYTIVYKPYFPPGVDAHDYVSVSPYKWPNPNTEDGYPYISKDGQINPESRTKYTDQRNISNMISAVQELGNAYFYSKDPKYAKHVEKIIKEFFLDEETKMNPHLNFGQCTPTKNAPTGSSNGLIETAGLSQMLESFDLAAEDGDISTDVIDGLKDWICKYLNWCDTSKIGVADRNGKQNHATHYDRQTTAYRLFLGNYNGIDYKQIAQDYLKKWTYKRLTDQINPDGSQPEELRRTKSWNYTNMNMKGFFQIALMAEKVGIDLWNYKGNRSIAPMKSMIDWFLPYLSKEKPWTTQQIQKEPVTKIQWCLEIAAKRYNDNKYIDAINNFQTIHTNIVYQ